LWSHRPPHRRVRNGRIREELVLAGAIGEDGLPVIHLDYHFWKPGWVKPSDDEWRETQLSLLAGDGWIVDGNDLGTLDLRLERAETIVLLDTPWWRCAGRVRVRASQASRRDARGLQGVGESTFTYDGGRRRRLEQLVASIRLFQRCR
jgi:adenylate kinase family enzyme